jgi:hypothetical protein
MSAAPGWHRLTVADGGLKDAARRHAGGLKAVLDPAIRHRRGAIRPGRRNAAVQPNKETRCARPPRRCGAGRATFITT